MEWCCGRTLLSSMNAGRYHCSPSVNSASLLYEWYVLLTFSLSMLPQGDANCGRVAIIVVSILSSCL